MLPSHPKFISATTSFGDRQLFADATTEPKQHWRTALMGDY